MFAKLSAALFAVVTVLAGSGLSITAGQAAVRTPSASAPRPVKRAPKASKQSIPAAPAFDAAKAFVNLGCSDCHGDDGVYRDEIKGSIGKPVDAVARWIRNAPSIKPGTDMPSFQGQIDEQSSIELAKWMQNRAEHLR
jgi:mono/diheme cytochrome c family protein